MIGNAKICFDSRLIHLLVKSWKKFAFWPKEWTKNISYRWDMNEARLFTTLRIIYVFSFVINFAAQHESFAYNWKECFALCWYKHASVCATYCKDWSLHTFWTSNMKILKIFTWPLLNQLIIYGRTIVSNNYSYY